MEASQAAEGVLGTPELRLPLGLAPPGTGLSWGGCLLTLASVVATGAALLLPGRWRWLLLAATGLGWLWRLRHPRPPAATPEPPAWLLLYPDRLVLQASDGGPQQYDLNAGLRVRLRYEGYQGERRSVSRAGRSYYSGYYNEVQLADGPALTFFVPDQATEEALRRQLRRWYVRGVDLHEYRLHAGQPGNRTLLLRAEPDYDEQMQLRRECGFSLYGRGWSRGPATPV